MILAMILNGALISLSHGRAICGRAIYLSWPHDVNDGIDHIDPDDDKKRYANGHEITSDRYQFSAQRIDVGMFICFHASNIPRGT